MLYILTSSSPPPPVLLVSGATCHLNRKEVETLAKQPATTCLIRRRTIMWPLHGPCNCNEKKQCLYASAATHIIASHALECIDIDRYLSFSS